LLADLAGGILAAGGLAACAAAVPRPAGRPARAMLAAALATAAAAEFAESSPLLAAAALAASAGLALVVLDRFGRVPRLSWLDLAMGATAAAALASVLGAPPELVAAAGGTVGGLALSRWQPSPNMLLAGAGVLVLGLGMDLAPAAAPLLVAAAWRSEPRVGSGPDFRWTVLAAILAFAATALALLGIGQFIRLSDLAGALAIGTVLAGIARAGLTVTDRLRESTRQALTDELTGLANRRHLLARLEDAIERGDELALLLIDLDGFKELNDTLGHHAGDQVLRQIGPRLGAAVRDHDTMARLGGDEFALVISPGDEAAASAAALRLRAALERSFWLREMVVHIDASVGIALYPRHAISPLGLLQRADVAMYEAKRMRTGHEVYLPERDRHSRQRLALIGELRGAIAAGDLMLHYQPKADLATGHVHGAEALVRWQHREHGLLAPMQFLPLAEQSGLTRALTAFVLDRALEEMAALRREGVDLAVAVNLGPADLLDLGLPQEVARVLEQRDFPPEKLKLEVSERMIMADPERTLDVIERLAALGVGLALDDFGAGQSSLSHLKDLRLDELKIDRSFVLGMTAGTADAAIVSSTVDLGHRLGLRVVGEGVTTGEAWDLLAECGCDEAQGNFLGTPMPMLELSAWLARRAGESRTGRLA
jgi:diguanylate cyclase (GGDEF)-like protein